MDPNLRKTGIDVLGDMPWGMHVCHFYQNRHNLADVLLPYFEAGLESNESCVWITTQPMEAKDAESALRGKIKNLDEYLEKGQIKILDYSQWYTKSGKLEMYKVLMAWLEKKQEALDSGFEGLRVTGNMSWVEQADWKDLMEYESMVNYSIGSHKMLAVCSYSIDKCDDQQMVDVACHHKFTLFNNRFGQLIKLGKFSDSSS